MLALVALLAGCGEREMGPVERVARERMVQAERVARRAGLPPDVQDFLGRAAGAVGAVFTVAYDEAGARTTLTQRPPERRIDVTKGGATESLLRLRDGTYACNADGCRQQPALPGVDPDLGVFAPLDLESAVAALGGHRSAFRFEVVSKDVAGVDAECLVTTPVAGGEADELCIAPDTGAILRIHSASRTLEAVSYKPSADKAAFKKP